MNPRDQTEDFQKTYSSKFAQFFLSKLGKASGRTRANSALITHDKDKDKDKNRQKDYSKYAVLRSVSKGIKNVNITDILTHEFETLEIKQKQQIKIQNTNIQTLKQMRNLYNQSLIIANKRQKDYNALKFDNEKLKDRQRQIKQVTNDITQMNNKLQNDCKNTLQNYQNLNWTKKSYEHIRLRLRNDKQVLAKRLLYSQQLLSYKKFQKQQLDQQFQRNKQLNSQTIRLLNQVKQNAHQFQEKKNDNLQLYSQGLRTQQQIEVFRNKRSQEIRNIAQFAMQDKDNNQKNWKKLLGVHKFVKVLLRDKMDRQMKKFSIVQKAYQQIKTKTGVWQSQQFVEKFINRDQTYGNLLYSIAQAQRKIFSLKKRNEQLKLRQNKLKDILNELQKPSKKVEIDLSKEYKLIAKYKQRNIQSQIIKQKLYKFGIQTLKKIDIYEQRQIKQYNKIYTRQTIPQIFDKINQKISKLNIEQIKQRLTESQYLRELQGIENKKNMRVLIKNEDQQFDDEDLIIPDNQAEQSKYIQTVRGVLNNENKQFFKQLKRKHDDKMKKKFAQKQKTTKKQFVIVRRQQEN